MIHPRGGTAFPVGSMFSSGFARIQMLFAPSFALLMSRLRSSSRRVMASNLCHVCLLDRIVTAVADSSPHGSTVVPPA